MPIRDAASIPTGAPVWVDLSSSDPGRARDFYCRLFGWTFEDSGPEYGNYVNFSKNGSMVAGMMANQQQGVPDSWTAYLATDDAKSLADSTLTAGGQVLMEPTQVGPMGTMAVIADPSGAVIGVWQAGEHVGYRLVGEAGAPAWLELHTRDYGRAVQFYQQVFDWQTTVISDTDEFRYTVYERDGVQYAGVMDASAFLPEGVPSNWQTYFQVADVDPALAMVQDLGGSVLQAAEETPYGRLASVTDPTGAPFRLITPPAG